MCGSFSEGAVTSSSRQIHCPGCKTDSLLLRDPVYDGFTKTGEMLKCATCGFEFDDEASVPYVAKRNAPVFTDADRSAAVQVFTSDEADRLCRHCANYVVNPFMQWCSQHKREVQATDTCEQFTAKKEQSRDASPI